MNPTAIYSKSGKGVQEASGKTSLLKRPDRAVLSAIDGRATLAEVAMKVGKPFDPAFVAVVAQLDRDGFVREVSSGTPAAAPAAARPAAKPGAKPAAADPGADLDFSSLGASKPAPAPSRPAPTPKPEATPSRSSGTPSRPAPPPPGSPFSQLDFSTLGTTPKPASQPSKPAAPVAPGVAKEQQSALAKAREEAEARAQAERDRLKNEAEAKTRAELEAKLRAEAEKKIKEEATSSAAAEAEAKVKAAREAALRAAEAKVKAEAEAKAKLEAERKAREETERRLEAERKAREEAERKAKEEAERARKEAEEKARREAEELRQRLEEERKAREEAERKAKEEAERVRRELEEERKRIEAERKREEEERAARKKREEEEAEARRKQREEEDRRHEEERAAKRKKREEEEAAREAEEQAKREAARRKREEEEAAREAEEEARREAKRKQREEEAALAAVAPKAVPKAEPKPEQSFGDSLLADLDSFSNKDEEERKSREEEERKAKAETERRNREEAERQAREEAERQRREDDERRRKEEQARREREEEERRGQEEERRKRDAEEIRRKATAATAAAMAKEGKGGSKSEDDIPISDDDLHMDEVKKEQAALAKTQAKEKEKEKERERAAVKVEREDAPRLRKPVKWGRLIGTTLAVVIVVGLIAAHVMPVPVADYERSATEALGRPVKIGDARFWLLTGPQIRFANVRIGEAKIAQVAASLSPGSLFSDRKEFTRVEIDGLTLPQEALADALFATVKADNLVIERIVVKSLELPGAAVMPKGLQADVQLDAKGALRAATVRGPDGLVAKIVPREGSIEFDVLAAGFTLPIAPEITLSKFGMKGSATQRGMKVDEWGGAIFNGGISGTASVRWGASWTVEGVVTVRGINAAVFAPALLSNGTGEGTGRFSMSGNDPAKLGSSGRLDGNFTVTQGTLGSYDLAKAIQTGGKQAAGSTSFTEMTGQVSYDRGAVSLRNVNIGAGALNAGASADIAQSGALSGRIVADVRTASRSQQATIVLGGTVKEPQVRN